MKIVLWISRFALTAAGPTAETTRRRGITFSPAGGATVVLAQRAPVTHPAAALAVPA